MPKRAFEIVLETSEIDDDLLEEEAMSQILNGRFAGTAVRVIHVKAKS